MTSFRSTVAKLSLSLLILGLLVYQVGLANLLQALSQATLWMVLLVLAFLFFNLLLASVNFALLLRPFHRIPLRQLYYYNLLSWSLGLFIPGRVGEFALVHFFQRKGIPLGRGFAITVLDKMITFFVVAFTAVFAAFLFFSSSDALLFLALVLLFFLGALFFVFSSPGRAFVRTVFLRRFSSQLAGFSKTLFFYVRKRPDLIGWNVLVTIIKMLSIGGLNALLFWAYGQQISFLAVFLISMLLLVATLLPITFNGVGVAEGLAVFLYALYVVDPAVILAVQLLPRIIPYAVASLVLLTNVATLLELRVFFKQFISSHQKS